MSRVDRIPSVMRSTYVRAGTSRACAVKAFCQECCGYDRESVRLCTASECPLYAWRPYQRSDEADDAAPDDAAGSAEAKSAGKRGEALARWREEQRQKKVAEGGVG